MKLGRADAKIAGGVAVLLLAAFWVNWRALHGEFIWDDVNNITGNPVMHSSRGLIDIWLAGPDVYDYYPVTWTTWWLEWRAWRKDTVGYHVLNVLLHAGAAGMLWRVFARLRVPGAFTAALLFVVHPTTVESVAWISERKNTLSLLLLAVTMALHLDSEAGDNPLRRRRFHWAAIVTFALALLSKPSGVMLPFVLLALAWWRRGRVTRRDVWTSAPFFAVSAGVSVVTVLVHHARGIGGVDVRSDGPLSRLAGAGWAVWHYLYKIIWPADLAFIYPRWELDPSNARHWLPLAALVALFAALYLGRRVWGRAPVAAMACYVALLLPILGFVNVYFMRFSLVSDHWQYAACPVVIALIVAAVASALQRLGPVVRSAGSVTLAGVACVALGLLSWREAHHYQTNAGLWAEAVRDNPRAALARNNHGAELWRMGRKDEARASFLLAIELDPGFGEPYLAMGGSYVSEQQPAEAITWFRKAVARSGGGTDPRLRLADALVTAGMSEEAVEWYGLALADDPAILDVRPKLAVLYEQQGQPARAVELYREHARRQSDDTEAWFLLGGALAHHGTPAESRRAFAESRRLSEGDHVALNAMGARLLTAGLPEHAADALRDAIRANPDYGPAHNALGKALEALNRPDESAAEFRAALRVQPGFREAQINLDRVLGGGGASTQPAS